MDPFPLLPIDRKIGAKFPGRAFVNGGRVRSFAINQIHRGSEPAVKDFDYVLVATTLEEAWQKLRPLGDIVLEGAKFPVFKIKTPDGLDLDVALARRESSTGTGHSDFEADFGIEVTLEQDAERRDFTMNMLSQCCDGGEIYAPFRALEHIERREIHVIRDSTFSDDPLRMYRAAQFAARLEFTIADETFALMRRDAHLAPTISRERFGAEFEKMIMRSRIPSIGMNVILESGLMTHILPEVAEGNGIIQNRHHMYDVYTHNMNALDSAASRGADYTSRLAATFHDVGKPRTRAPRPDGQGFTFYNHERVGADMVPSILRRLSVNTQKIEDVVSLVACHMYQTIASHGEPLTDAALRRSIIRIARGTEDLEVARLRLQLQFDLRCDDRMGSGRSMHEREYENSAYEQRCFELIEKGVALNVKGLDIKGVHVMDEIVRGGTRPMGYRGDKLIGDVLNELLKIVTEDPAMNERSKLIAATQEIVAAEYIQNHKHHTLIREENYQTDDVQHGSRSTR